MTAPTMRGIAPLYRRKSATLGKLYTHAQFYVIHEGVQSRLDPIPQLPELSGNRIQPVRRQIADKQIGLQGFKVIEKLSTAAHRLAAALTDITDGLKRQNGIQFSCRCNRRGRTGTSNILAIGRHESRPAAAPCRVAAGDAVTSMGRVNAQNSDSPADPVCRQILPHRVNKSLIYPASFAGRSILLIEQRLDQVTKPL